MAIVRALVLGVMHELRAIAVEDVTAGTVMRGPRVTLRALA
jgi:hypothetical protein